MTHYIYGGRMTDQAAARHLRLDTQDYEHDHPDKAEQDNASNDKQVPHHVVGEFLPFQSAFRCRDGLHHEKVVLDTRSPYFERNARRINIGKVIPFRQDLHPSQKKHSFLSVSFPDELPYRH